MNQKPNLLFVFADQWRRQAAGFAGNPQVATPAMDCFAEESFQFAHAVSGCPVCSPYRASLMTGQYPHRHGVIVNDQAIRSDAVPLGAAFARAGYDTGYVGKWHLSLHDRTAYIPPADRLGFAFWRGFDCTHDYNHSAYYEDEDRTVRWWDGYDADLQSEEVCRFIASRPGESRPWAMVLSWGPPHNPYQTAPQRFRRMYDPSRIELRPNVPPEAAAQAREDLAGYYAHVSALDACFARLLAALNAAGQAEDTIVVLTSDHGDMLGSQGLSRKQHPYDESIRVPWLLRWPAALGRRAQADNTPFDAPDILPTLLGLCGIEVPPTAQGADFSPLVRGQGATADVPDAALLACYRPFHEVFYRRNGRDYRGLRTARHTYCRDHEGPWLLFDNQADPHQLQNLAADPAHAALVADLDAKLTARLAAVGDPFETGDQLIARWGIRLDEKGDIFYSNPSLE